ncbi:MAG TPA: hypothetical protein VIL30_24785 [Ramlibacter sp.]|jgi:hypothetical protein
MKNFIQRTPVFLAAAASIFLASCGGGGGGDDANVGRESVPWNVAIPVAALDTQQQKALDQGLTLLRRGESTRAITALQTLRSELVGIHPEVEAGVGLGYAQRANLGLAEYRAVRSPRTFPDGKGTRTQPADDVALYDLTSYVPGVSSDLVIQDGNIALQMLVPPGTSVASLPEARQAEIGIVATVQFLRVVAKVMGSNSRITSDARIESQVARRYDAQTRAALNLSARLLTATNDALRKEVTSGLVVSLPDGLTALLADGDIAPDELTSLLKRYRL